MPRTATGTRGAGTTRRTALAATGAAAAGLLAACSSSDPSDGPAARKREAAARAEAALRLTTSTASAALRDRYEAVAVRHPVVRPLLAPLHTEAAQHVTALAGPRPAAPSPSPSTAVPDDPEAALRELAAAARRTSDTHTAALADAAPELARLLASVAAAAAVHAYLLTEQREGGR